MKNIIAIPMVFVITALLMISSCVSKGKFLTSEDWVRKLQNDSSNTHRALGDCDAQVKKLGDSNAALQAQIASSQNELQNLTSKSKMTIAEQANRLKHLQDLIQSQKDIMNKLRKTIADALVNFKPDELSVYIKDGNVYVALEEKLLFKSGSDVVNPKGKEALGTLASVLNVTPDIAVQIEGHTDTVPIKNARFEDNWALSVARATSVIRILTKDYGVDPRRITASGRGEFHPVQSNETAEGKQSNRRTEIILSPNLEDLYKLLNE